MPYNIARQISGPAIIDLDGTRFYSKTPIMQKIDRETFNVGVEGFGDEVSKRVIGKKIEIEFTPAGEWENLSVLFPHRVAPLGSFVNRIVPITAYDAVTNVFTATAHGLTTGMSGGFGLLAGAFPVATPALSESTIYFINATTANGFTVHLTYAAAVSNLSPVDLTSGTLGTLRFVHNPVLTIYPIDGSNPIKFHNCPIVDMPEVIASTRETLLGPVKFRGFLQHGKTWTDASALYTDSGIATVSDTTFDPAAIKTLPYVLAWGATAPWEAIYTMTGFRMKPALQLTDIGDVNDGARTARIDSLSISGRLTPKGISAEQLMSKLDLQGAATAALGTALGGASPDNLNASSGSDVYLRIYGAALQGGGISYSMKADRLDELTFHAQRTFASGVANPLFYVGATAPA